MIRLSQKQQKIIAIIFEKGAMQSSGIYSEMIKLGEDTSLVTIKRTLSEMVNEDILVSTGLGRSTNYNISIIGRIFAEIDAKKYCSVEPDKRFGLDRYNFDLLAALPIDIFTVDESRALNEATIEYEARTKNLPPAIQKKELERLIIELSWKSSKIEGNTYTLLDTEKLILENKTAVGHDRKESQMILNHKDAFNFVHENSAQFKTITKKNIEELHAILVKDLSVGLGLRKKPVGILGSVYRPLDNIYQITEAIEALGRTISETSTPYAKALIALLGISYIQPFEDGNKRTSRLAANAVLLAHGLAPLSYRSVEESDYREAMLAFYELNSIMPFKKIFIDQYKFAALNYAVK
ncbi:MAG: Fic family protein [Patescibacteria group bacterium]